MTMPVTPNGTSSAAPNDAAALHLQLLRRFELRCAGSAVDLPESVQRVLAYLAVSSQPQRRSTVAATLWMDTTEEKASAKLRTALWRARRIDPFLVMCRGAYVSLGENVEVDVTDLILRTRAFLGMRGDGPPGATPEELCADLLPDWYEDWVLFERERLRQIRLHGLEALCLDLLRRGQHLEAIEVGMMAATAEPLRESAQGALIRAHIADGNMSEAVRTYDHFAAVLDEALGIAPTESLRSLVAPYR